MSDLIRRKDAIDYFVTNIGVVDADGYAVDDYDERVKAWTERFSGIPSVEPEQKKGEWSFIGDNMFKCTCCGVLYTTHQLNGLRNYDTDPYVPNFCPNCGSDMRMRGK